MQVKWKLYPKLVICLLEGLSDCIVLLATSFDCLDHGISLRPRDRFDVLREQGHISFVFYI